MDVNIWMNRSKKKTMTCKKKIESDDERVDGLTQSLNPGADAKSKPWTTRSLIPGSSDAKSNSGRPSIDERERKGSPKAVISVKIKS